MNLAELHADTPLRRSLFPITEKAIFLAHGGVSPLSGPAVRAIQAEAVTGSLMQQESDYLAKLAHARKTAAGLYGVLPEEVALIGPTSMGLSLVANGLEWKPGDEVVFYPDDYPANVYPWKALERYGVKLVPLIPERLGAITPELVERALTPRTKLVALASVHFLSGYRIDVLEIGKRVKAAGAFFCLDAIQSLGALDTPLDYCDFVAADSHKWMLGPLAAGILIVKSAAQEHLRPVILGTENVKTHRFLAEKEIRYVSTAARYEAGTMNLLGIVGMTASLDLIASVGISKIETHLGLMRKIIVNELQTGDVEFLTDINSPFSGITTFRFPKREMKPLFQSLSNNGVTASLRWTRDGTEWLRFSPHFYIAESELRKAIALLNQP